MVKNARPIHGTDAVLKVSNIDGDVRILYKDQEDFERIARQFGIFEEWKVVQLCIHLSNCKPVISFVCLFLNWMWDHGTYFASNFLLLLFLYAMFHAESPFSYSTLLKMTNDTYFTLNFLLL